jgi:hypothetical protein
MSHMPASRTPEGDHRLCPLCAASIVVEPSEPLGDAPCPCCGHLLWSTDSIAGVGRRPENPYPAPVISNRILGHLFGRGSPRRSRKPAAQPKPSSASSVGGTPGTGTTLVGLLGELQEIEGRLAAATANRRRRQGFLNSILSTLRSRSRRTKGHEKSPVISTGASGVSDPWIP